MSYLVRLEVFEGPFDLLLHLIERAELDIYDIPIARITVEFLNYIQAMQMLNLQVASDFLVVASTLIQIKARMLLPRRSVSEESETAEDDDPRQELVDKLLEYKRYKELALELRTREEEMSRVFPRTADQVPVILTTTQDYLKGLTIWDLVEAMKDVLASIQDEEPRVIPREEVSIRQRMTEIMALLKEKPRIRFHEVFGSQSSRVSVITGFMALLELIRLRRLRVTQTATFGDIWLIAGEEGGTRESDSGQSGD